MFDLASAVDAPARERVVVLSGKCEDVRNSFGFAAPGDDLGARRLDVARFIPRAALQHGRTAVPAPGCAEPCERLWIARLLQRRFRPSPAAISVNHHLPVVAV